MLLKLCILVLFLGNSYFIGREVNSYIRQTIEGTYVISAKFHSDGEIEVTNCKIEVEQVR